MGICTPGENFGSFPPTILPITCPYDLLISKSNPGVLYCSSITIGGVRLAGCPLWTRKYAHQRQPLTETHLTFLFIINHTPYITGGPQVPGVLSSPQCPSSVYNIVLIEVL
ncbi:hypothetical protein TNCV_2739061 [Trichonephila clavipes]|nr:hypothetical protein TNCV_2739061 [Trichonephila clavipes]